MHMSDNSELRAYRERLRVLCIGRDLTQDHAGLKILLSDMRSHVERAQQAQVETMKRFEEVRGSGPSVVPITPEMIADRTEAVNTHSAAVNTAREWSDLHDEVKECFQNCGKLILDNPAGHG